MEKPTERSESPYWGSTTKLIVGLTIVALIAATVIYFRGIVGPVLLAFILAFLLHPLAAWGNKTLHMSWRMTVNVIYLLVLVVIIGLFTLTGFAIFQQAQSLVSFVSRFVSELPAMVENLSTQAYQIGPLYLDLSQLDLQALAQQLLNTVQPLLGQAGSLVSLLAASAANTVAWVLFILLVSYFLLSETGQLRENLLHFEIPGYNADIERLIHKLATIWVLSARPVGDFVPCRCFLLHFTDNPGDAPDLCDCPHGRCGALCPLSRPPRHLDGYGHRGLLAAQ
jgi:predicted PurR-regulated permease PerM